MRAGERPFGEAPGYLGPQRFIRCFEYGVRAINYRKGAMYPAALIFDHAKNVFVFDDDIDVYDPAEFFGRWRPGSDRTPQTARKCRCKTK